MKNNPGRKEHRKASDVIGTLYGKRKMKRDNNAQKVEARKAARRKKKRKQPVSEEAACPDM